jgi:transcriptional antiterminator NusG
MAHHWYIVHAYSNFEKKVAEAIREQAALKGLEKDFSEVLVPTEEVVEMRRGKRVSSERRFFPGYVLVKMNMNDDTYHLVKSVGKVTGFLGSGNKPQPISEREVAHIMNQVEEGVESPRP